MLEEGQAVTNFDATGCGLIAVDLDGQVRQLLGNLLPEERTGGGRVRAGDRVFIRAVDPLRNSCTFRAQLTARPARCTHPQAHLGRPFLPSAETTTNPPQPTTHPPPMPSLNMIIASAMVLVFLV